MAQTVNYRLKYGRNHYRALADAHIAVADAVDVHESAGSAAKSFAGARPSINGEHPFSFDGYTAATSKETISTLKSIARDKSETAERRETAMRLIEEWHTTALAARDADRKAKEAVCAASRINDPDTGDMLALNGRYAGWTKASAEYTLSRVLLALNDPENPSSIKSESEKELKEFADKIARALATYNGPAVTVEDILQKFEPKR